MSIKWTNQLVLAVIAEARKAGCITANRKLNELQNCGVHYKVVDGERVTGTLLDVCGFADLKISTRGKFFQLAEKLTTNSQQRFYCHSNLYDNGTLGIFDSTMRQELSINIAACRGQAKVLKNYGIECHIQSHTD